MLPANDVKGKRTAFSLSKERKLPLSERRNEKKQKNNRKRTEGKRKEET